jgi:hypothetical protein
MWNLQDGWKKGTPEIIREGIAVMPGLNPIVRSFNRLSRGRDYTMMGSPLPTKYRDMRDEIERLKWGDDDEAEFLLTRMDDEFMALVNDAMKASS